MRRLALLIACCSPWPLLAVNPDKKVKEVLEPFAIEGLAQGSSYHISYTGKERPEIQRLVDERLASFDKIFSNYRPDSDISRFNNQNGLDWFKVDADLVRLVELSHKISQQSQGAFDITVGALLKIWGFGPFKTADHRLPTDAQIAEALKDVGYRQLLFQKSPPALKKTNTRVYVDVSGIAQGYSVDKIAKFLETKAIQNYMVEIGGEIRTKGDKNGQPWTLAVDSPSSEPGNAAALVHVVNKGLTTAGDYRDYFEKDGKRFSHTIDPRNGRPVAHKLASITVIAASTGEADGWDTALMVLGPEESRKLVPKMRLAAFMIMREGNSFVTESLGDFEKYRVKP